MEGVGSGRSSYTLYPIPSPSLVAERVDRVELGCLAGRVDAEQHADDGGEPEGEQDRLRGDDHVPARARAGSPGDEQPEQDAHDAADHAHGDRLDQELAQDIAALGPDRLADADLAG